MSSVIIGAMGGNLASGPLDRGLGRRPPTQLGVHSSGASADPVWYRRLVRPAVLVRRSGRSTLYVVGARNASRGARLGKGGGLAMIKRAGMLLGGLLIAGVPASAQPAPTGDAQIGKQIESSFRHDPYLKNNDIDVRVKNGVATLSGLVDTRSERVRAETLA